MLNSDRIEINDISAMILICGPASSKMSSVVNLLSHGSDFVYVKFPTDNKKLLTLFTESIKRNPFYRINN